MRELYRSPYYILTIDDDRRLVFRTRLERRFETLAEAEAAFEAIARGQEGVDRSLYSLLVDVRRALARNDSGFEQLILDYVPRHFGGFRRVAVLVKTQAGRLQLMRLGQTMNIPLRVFTDEAEALAYLT